MVEGSSMGQGMAQKEVNYNRSPVAALIYSRVGQSGRPHEESEASAISIWSLSNRIKQPRLPNDESRQSEAPPKEKE